MLVFSCRVNDRVMIGDDVCVVVTKINGGVARLGFEAPIEIPIDRQEVRMSKARDGTHRPGVCLKPCLPALEAGLMEIRWREAALEAARLFAGPVVEDEANHPADRFWAILEALGVDPQAIPKRQEARS